MGTLEFNLHGFKTVLLNTSCVTCVFTTCVIGSTNINIFFKRLIIIIQIFVVFDF